MESTGMGRSKNQLCRYLYIVFVFPAYRIHASETTAGLLEEIGGFNLEYRGVTEIKVNVNIKI
jgi:hypothetical protein